MGEAHRTLRSLGLQAHPTLGSKCHTTTHTRTPCPIDNPTGVKPPSVRAMAYLLPGRVHHHDGRALQRHLRQVGGDLVQTRKQALPHHTRATQPESLRQPCLSRDALLATLGDGLEHGPPKGQEKERVSSQGLPPATGHQSAGGAQRDNAASPPCGCEASPAKAP